MDRIATFKSFIEQKPDDPFPRYGLAMEYRNTGRYQEAQKVFDTLIETFPDYLASYLMAGNNLVDLDRRDDARATLQRGIEVAGRQGNGHTKAELQSALAEIGG